MGDIIPFVRDAEMFGPEDIEATVEGAEHRARCSSHPKGTLLGLLGPGDLAEEIPS